MVFYFLTLNTWPLRNLQHGPSPFWTLNFQGIDGAALSGSDLVRRRPNAVTILYREIVGDAGSAMFDKWYQSGSKENVVFWRNEILKTTAVRAAIDKMNELFFESEKCINMMPEQLVDVIVPVQEMLQSECLRLVDAIS